MMMPLLVAALSMPVPAQAGLVVKLDLPARVIEGPVLRHRVLPPLEEISSGNAATHYTTAFAPESLHFTRATKDFSQKLEKWSSMPLAELAREDSPIFSERFFPLAELERGARRTYCDWQMKERLREGGVATLLPDIQGFRMLANFMRIRARWHLANNRPEMALRDVQTLLAFGRHISEGPTLIQYLVGVAVCHLGFHSLQEYMAHPGAANMFWPMAYTPRQFLPFMNALEGERVFIGAEFPGLERDKPVTREKALELARRFDKLMGLVNPGQGNSHPMFMPGLALAGYTEAKAHLIGKLKVDPQVVERMPVAQVVLIHQLDQYELTRDEMFKAAMEPLPQALPIIRDLESKMRTPPMRVGPNTLLRLVLPAMERVVLAQHRADRTLAALRAVEALRHHVGLKGELPASLEETGLPVPVDPYTAKPFIYTRSGPTSCVVGGIAPGALKPNHADSVQYEVTIRPRVSSKE